MISRSLLVLSFALITACGGDDGVGHLADAPWIPDAPADGPLDAPMVDDVELGITLAGNGSGTISSSPAGILCGATCTSAFPVDTVVTLTAVPATGSLFTGWSGACSGSLPTCEVTLGAAADAIATFTLATYVVTVSKSGAGSGTISGNGIACGETCTITVDHGTAIALSAAPAALSTFAGWGGACSGTGACAVTVTAATTISASFALDDVTLFVTPGGTGTGTVTSSPAGINCGVDCDQTYTAGQMTTLTAVAATGSTFTGWSGAGCTGTAPCTVTMNAAVTVTATFALNSYPLTVTRLGNGSVTSLPAGIACGADCDQSYTHGTAVTLTATASTGSSFNGWTGACTGTGACVVSMTEARSVIASFSLDTHTLTVARNGSGTVSGPGFSCGQTCSADYGFGTVVALTATPTVGWMFTGWSGGCTGTGACMVTMDMARNVTATFTLNTYSLSVFTTGTGTGSVAGTGIDCGLDCMETVGHGTMITLTPTATATSFFAGWSGACSGAGACTVTMDMAKSVTATFTINSYALTVMKTGSGSGNITGTGISCGTNGTDCTESFTHGTLVALSATPSTGTMFTGWTGSCSGTGTCMVTMDMARSVTATFVLDTHTLEVTRAGTGRGGVTGTGINCGTDCTETVGYGTTITLTATASMTNATRSKFTGWGGACSGIGTCTVTITSATSVSATFELSPNLLFVSTAVYTGNLGGLAGADAKCQQLATAASLPGNYVAYLSSINGNTPIHAPSRVGAASGWVRAADNVPVMNSITQFAAGTLFNPPRLTETGVDVGGTQFPFAWTGTSTSGQYDGACSPAAFFSPWGGAFGTASAGAATSTTSTVVKVGDASCGSELRLYCLGIDRTAVAQ